LVALATKIAALRDRRSATALHLLIVIAILVIP
jgi:hypothetical protein